MNDISLVKDRPMLHNLTGCRIASFPGPTQLSVTCSTEKWERAWYLFSREWGQDIEVERVLIVWGSDIAHKKWRYQLSNLSIASGGDCHALDSHVHVVGWIIHETLPVCYENSITPSSCEEMYQALPAESWGYMRYVTSTVGYNTQPT